MVEPKLKSYDDSSILKNHSKKPQTDVNHSLLTSDPNRSIIKPKRKIIIRKIPRRRRRKTNPTNSPAIQISKPTKRKAQDNLEPSTSQNNQKRSKSLRPILIDGMNVATDYGNLSTRNRFRSKTFDAIALKKAYDYFTKKLNHDEVTIVLPPRAHLESNTEFRKLNLHVLDDLLDDDPYSIKFCNQRRVGTQGNYIRCHDDLMLFDIEKNCSPGAIIVSKDNFKREWDMGDDNTKKVIEERVLPFNFHRGQFFCDREPMGTIYDSNRMRNPNLHPRNKDRNNNARPITLEQFLKF